MDGVDRGSPGRHELQPGGRVKTRGRPVERITAPCLDCVSALVVLVLAGGCVDPVQPDPRHWLTRFYEATGGPRWDDRDNWATDAPLDTWYGVTTDSEGNVTRLDLAFNGLTGSIPPEIGRLQSLEHLNLMGNRLISIPAEIGNLQNLQSLNLAGNDLRGPIRPELGNLENLELLTLVESKLQGPIPAGTRQTPEPRTAPS